MMPWRAAACFLYAASISADFAAFPVIAFVRSVNVNPRVFAYPVRSFWLSPHSLVVIAWTAAARTLSSIAPFDCCKADTNPWMLSFAESASLDVSFIDPENSEKAVINAVSPMPTQPPSAAHMPFAAVLTVSIVNAMIPPDDRIDTAAPATENAACVALSRMPSKNANNGPLSRIIVPNAITAVFTGSDSHPKKSTTFPTAQATPDAAYATPSNAYPSPTNPRPKSSKPPKTGALKKQTPNHSPKGDINISPNYNPVLNQKSDPQ